MTTAADKRLYRVRAVRAELHAAGPKRRRPFEGDFERVALPAADGDILRDILVAHGAHVVIEVGLAYGSSALAIGEALCSTGGTDVSHIVIDAFQATAYDNVGWDALNAAGLAAQTTFIGEASSIALARLASDGFTADAAWPSVAVALRYFDLNLGWRPVSIAGRLTVRRVPDEPFEPSFTDFKPF